nr:MAG TPA: hypothetical protein [Bacteriophage sp.]
MLFYLVVNVISASEQSPIDNISHAVNGQITAPLQ